MCVRDGKRSIIDTSARTHTLLGVVGDAGGAGLLAAVFSPTIDIDFPLPLLLLLR